MKLKIKALRSVAPLAPKGMGKCAWTTGAGVRGFMGAQRISVAPTLAYSFPPSYLTIHSPRRPICTVPGPDRREWQRRTPRCAATDDGASYALPSFHVSFNECVHVRECGFRAKLGAGSPTLKHGLEFGNLNGGGHTQSPYRAQKQEN